MWEGEEGRAVEIPKDSQEVSGHLDDVSNGCKLKKPKLKISHEKEEITAFDDKSQHLCWYAVNKNMWSPQQNLYITSCCAPEILCCFEHVWPVKDKLWRKSKPNFADIFWMLMLT